MSYSTNTTILLLLPNLPQSAGSSGYTRVATLVDLHVSRADNMINSAIVDRYDVSGFDTSGSVPPMLRTYSEDIASYFTIRSLYSSDGQNKNDWEDSYYRAVEELEKLRTGEMNLCDTAGAQIPTRTSATVDEISSNTEDYTPFFDVDSPLNWKHDSNRISDIEDDRD